MLEPAVEKEKDGIVKELKGVGVCEACILRYLGVKDPIVYRDRGQINSILGNIPPPPGLKDDEERKADNDKNKGDQQLNGNGSTTGSDPLSRSVPCSVCLGLLQECKEEEALNKIAEEIGKAGIEASSYVPLLTLPISIHIRANAIWFHLAHKFPSVYNDSFRHMKPEGISLKTVWKWMCTSILKDKVDKNSEWMTNGDLEVNMALKYDDDNVECQPLLKLIRQKNKKGILTRGAADQVLTPMTDFNFRTTFRCPPNIPSSILQLEKITCSHVPLFVAGRYCKYSRDVSQSPWLDNDGKRIRGQGSVQEFISQHVVPAFNCEALKFSASGREDSDVRMLGKGRPFVLELSNPRKTIFTQQKMKLLQKTINESTNLISVRDLQLVDKSELRRLKDGEETKNKLYTALCKTQNRDVTPEVLQVLNETKVPIQLQQITPLRVLHRRTLMTRPRSILEMRAEPAKRSKEMFILHLKTEAGTYVKEFVHGDFGRTEPSVSDLLGYPTEILSLDVSEIELDWPPSIGDDS